MVREIAMASSLELRGTIARLKRLQRKQAKQSSNDQPATYEGFVGGVHLVRLPNGESARIPQSRCLTRGAIAIGQKVSVVGGCLDAISGD